MEEDQLKEIVSAVHYETKYIDQWKVMPVQNNFLVKLTERTGGYYDFYLSFDTKISHSGYLHMPANVKERIVLPALIDAREKICKEAGIELIIVNNTKPEFRSFPEYQDISAWHFLNRAILQQYIPDMEQRIKQGHIPFNKNIYKPLYKIIPSLNILSLPKDK